MNRQRYYVRSDVLPAVNMKIAVFWDVTPCTLVNTYHPFHLPGKVHDVLSQKNVISKQGYLHSIRQSFSNLK
jgi:hypothetical protein